MLLLQNVGKLNCAENGTFKKNMFKDRTCLRETKVVKKNQIET